MSGICSFDHDVADTLTQTRTAGDTTSVARAYFGHISHRQGYSLGSGQAALQYSPATLTRFAFAQRTFTSN